MLIFVAGVHGVGKGFLCSLAEKEFEVTYASASNLIKDNSNIIFDRTKLTATPDKNQAILLAAIGDLKDKSPNILLDGHFSLINKDGDVNDLKVDIFKEMRPDGVILISEPSEIVIERLLSRDGASSNYDITKLINSERDNAIKITSELNIPLIILESPNKDIFFCALNEFGMSLSKSMPN